jgi:hypothetical protein
MQALVLLRLTSGYPSKHHEYTVLPGDAHRGGRGSAASLIDLSFLNSRAPIIPLLSAAKGRWRMLNTAPVNWAASFFGGLM